MEPRAGLGALAFPSAILHSAANPIRARGWPAGAFHSQRPTEHTAQQWRQTVFVFLIEIRDELRLITAPTFTFLRPRDSGSGQANDFPSYNLFFWLFGGQCHFGKISLLFSIF